MKRLRSAIIGMVLTAMLVGGFPLAAHAAKGEVYVVKVSGTINPAPVPIERRDTYRGRHCRVFPAS